MGKYVHKFANQAAYNQARNNNYIEPWVSYTEGRGLDYNKSEEERLFTQPATIVALGSGNISWNLDGYVTNAMYSKNGSEWTSLTSGTSISVVQGDRIMLKGTHTGQPNGIGTIASSAQFNIEGNSTSLYFGNEFISRSGRADECMFRYLFKDCTTLISARNFKLQEIAEEDCYTRMFQGCTSLTEAPELPSINLAMSCYTNMFYGCSNLQYIKAMFTTTPSSTYTSNWVNGVAATGTFVKNTAAQWNVTGVNGIPSGWTVQTASS